MNAVSRTLALIPDRVARTQTGSLFNPAAPGVCSHPERVAHLARFLEWLGPLREVTKDDLHTFGLLTPYARPVMEEEAEADAPMPGASATLEAPAAPTPEAPPASTPFEDAFH